MVKQKINVAKYLEQQLALCGKSQREVASDIGYANANVITMFKSGVTKIPVNKVGLLAKSLGVDPAFLLRLLMGEYMPDAWGAIEAILGKERLLSDQDRMVVEVTRSAIGDEPIDLTVEENRKALSDTVMSIAARDRAKADAAVKRIAALPSNSPGRRG